MVINNLLKININILDKVIDAKPKRWDHAWFVCKFMGEFVIESVFEGWVWFICI